MRCLATGLTLEDVDVLERMGTLRAEPHVTLPLRASQIATQRPCGLVKGRFLVARANEGNASPTKASSSLKESWGLDSRKQERLEGPREDELRGQDGAYKSLGSGAAAPMPAAQGGKGVEQLEQVSVERNLTSGGERWAGDVEMDPTVIRAKASGREGDVHVELMAVHKRHDNLKGPLKVLQQRSEVLEQGAATNRGPAVQAWKRLCEVKKTHLRDHAENLQIRQWRQGVVRAQ